MNHRRPKLWNGPNALGEALVRGLELTGSPYLTAIAGDVYAGVMDGKGEVKFGGGGQVFCVWRAYERASLIARYPYGFYYVYSGEPETVIEGKSDGYYSLYNDVYLGPLVLTGGGPSTGDAFSLPFSTTVTEAGYFTDGGAYAGPAYFSPDGALYLRWAVLDAKRATVVKRGAFGPWDGVEQRFRLNQGYARTFQVGRDARLFEDPREGIYPINPVFPSTGRMQEVFETNFPGGFPEGEPAFKPGASLDVSAFVAPGFYAKSGVESRIIVAMASVRQRIFAVVQASMPGEPGSQLHELRIAGTTLVSVAQATLTSSYSWTIATDGRNLVVGGWSGSLVRGVLEVFSLGMAPLCTALFPINEQPYGVAIGHGRIYAAAFSSTSVLHWRIAELLENPAASPEEFEVGDRDVEGALAPEAPRYLVRAIAVKERAVFVMSAGRRAGTVPNSTTGGNFVCKYSLTGRFIKSVELSTPGAGNYADPFEYTMFSML